MKLPNTGQAVITDLGEGKDIHPQNKHDVAARLVRWALAKDYGMKIPYPQSRVQEHGDQGQQGGGHLRLLRQQAASVRREGGGGLRGLRRGQGVALGKGQRCSGKDTVEVWSDKVAKPIAVRYAWADNPVCNLYQQGRSAGDAVPHRRFPDGDHTEVGRGGFCPPKRRSAVVLAFTHGVIIRAKTGASAMT